MAGKGQREEREEERERAWMSRGDKRATGGCEAEGGTTEVAVHAEMDSTTTANSYLHISPE